MGATNHRTGHSPRAWERDPRIPILAACIVAIFLAGCGKDRVIAPSRQNPPARPILSTPQWVLTSLVQAYTGRDSVWYAQLFDDQYQGTSIDLSQPPGQQLLSFVKADEVGHVRALARSATIGGIDFYLGPSFVRYTDLADPPGWATIQTALFLSIDDPPVSFIVYGDATQAFKFIPTTPASSSPTDTTWTIIRWAEVAP